MRHQKINLQMKDCLSDKWTTVCQTNRQVSIRHQTNVYQTSIKCLSDINQMSIRHQSNVYQTSDKCLRQMSIRQMTWPAVVISSSSLSFVIIIILATIIPFFLLVWCICWKPPSPFSNVHFRNTTKILQHKFLTLNFLLILL